MQAWKTFSQPSFRTAIRRGHGLVRVPPQQPMLRRLLHQQPAALAKTHPVSTRPWTAPMTVTRASQLYSQQFAASASSRLSLARQTIRRGFASEANQASSTTTAAAAPVKQTFSQRIKDMIKKYGYTALAVYLGISTLDLAATFVIVQAVGMDKIEVAQAWMKEKVGPLVGYKSKDGGETKDASRDKVDDLDKVDDEQMGAIYNTASSLWGVFVIAYGIHKLLVPLRVVATSFLTPPLVKWLVKRGWIRDVTKKAVEGASKSGALVAMLGLGASTTANASMTMEEEEEEEAGQQ
ncbi:hypothetical protein DFQ26_007827 [Actinomortierella ambigua]|nr:hypothetical protein DFQ26_007827 [Actinomortierella ambigua]